MRALNPRDRLQGFSLPEIVLAFNRLILEIGSAVKVNGRRIKPGPAINAIVLEFMAMPPDKRLEILRAGAKRLEAAENSDDQVQITIGE